MLLPTWPITCGNEENCPQPQLGRYSPLLVSSATGLSNCIHANKPVLILLLAVLPPGLMMIAQIFLGHDRAFAVTIFTIQLTLNGAVTAGYLGNGLDIAPNFSGTIFGLANTLSSLSGFLSAFMVADLTQASVSAPVADLVTFCRSQLVEFLSNCRFLFSSSVFRTLMGSGRLCLASWQ